MAAKPITVERIATDARGVVLWLNDGGEKRPLVLSPEVLPILVRASAKAMTAVEAAIEAPLEDMKLLPPEPEGEPMLAVKLKGWPLMAYGLTWVQLLNLSAAAEVVLSQASPAGPPQ